MDAKLIFYVYRRTDCCVRVWAAMSRRRTESRGLVWLGGLLGNELILIW